MLCCIQKKDKKLKNAQPQFNNVKRKHGKDKITVTGHSLGGSISE